MKWNRELEDVVKRFEKWLVGRIRGIMMDIDGNEREREEIEMDRMKNKKVKI